MMRRILWSTLAVAVLAALARPALAEPAHPDEAFLKAREAAVQEILDRSKDTMSSPEGALQVIRKLLRERDQALVDLQPRQPLTTFDGIETQDRLDRTVVLALNEVVNRGIAADTTLPPEPLAVRYTRVLGPMPELGDKPVAFMVLEMAKVAVAAADTVSRAPDFPERAAAQLAERLIKHATNHYAEIDADLILGAKAKSLRQTSVVMRLRCPKDGGTYNLVNMKNKVYEDGSVSTIYWLNCSTCGSPLALEFPLELMSRLNEAGQPQRLKNKPEKRRPHGDLEP